MKTVVIGSGSWGTALAQTLADNGQDVTIYGVNAAEVNDINENHKNSKYFAETALNPVLRATYGSFRRERRGCRRFGGSDHRDRTDLQGNRPAFDKKAIVVNVAKGFNPKTNERLSDVIRRCISPDHLSSVVSLIGPSHAEEVVIRQLTSIDAVSQNDADAIAIQNLFSNKYLRIYTGNDEVGSELGAAIKNVMAIASGILSGLGYGDNTRAALITRGLQEMIRYGTYFGGKEETFIGLTGIGDLIVTCTSVHSRNFEAGHQIGSENTVENFFRDNTKTVEGVRTAKIVHEVAKEKGIDMPICEEVYQILYEGKEPKDCANDLMIRKLKAEF